MQEPSFLGIDLFEFIVFIAKIGVSALAICGCFWIAQQAAKDDFDNNW